MFHADVLVGDDVVSADAMVMAIMFPRRYNTLSQYVLINTTSYQIFLFIWNEKDRLNYDTVASCYIKSFIPFVILWWVSSLI